MAGLNIAELFTKIVLRNDVAEAWATSTLVLEKGEPALEIDLEKGVAKFKIGDGSRNFNELPYSTSTPEEIQAMIDEAIKNADFSTGDGTTVSGIQSVTLESGSENGTLKLIVDGTEIDNIAVTGLGTAAFTDASDYATAAQGEKADRAMSVKGTVGSAEATVEAIPTDAAVGDTYKVVADLTIDADASYTGAEEKVVSGDLIVAMPEGKWFIVSCGAVEEAKALTEGISAEVTGGVVGSASAANAGEVLNIEISEVNTDYIKNGEKELIINGGSASATNSQ